MPTDSYLVYVRIYGRLASMGAKLSNGDYGETNDGAFIEHPAEIQAAISVAAQDVSLGVAMRSRKDFRDELGRLLG